MAVNEILAILTGAIAGIIGAIILIYLYNKNERKIAQIEMLINEGKKYYDLSSKSVDNKQKEYLEKTIEFFEKAIEVEPDNASAWYNKGTALGKLGKLDEAIKAFDKAIEIEPDIASAWNNKSTALGKLGKLDEAIKALDKAIEIEPDNASAWYNHACVYSMMGKKEKALSDLKKAIDLDKSFKEEAKKDMDFKNLFDDENFKKILGLPVVNAKKTSNIKILARHIQVVTILLSKTELFIILYCDFKPTPMDF